MKVKKIEITKLEFKNGDCYYYDIDDKKVNDEEGRSMSVSKFLEKINQDQLSEMLIYITRSGYKSLFE